MPVRAKVRVDDVQVRLCGLQEQVTWTQNPAPEAARFACSWRCSASIDYALVCRFTVDEIVKHDEVLAEG